jgi:predicted nucleotide-binding protein
MRKAVFYKNVKFSQEVIQKGLNKIDSFADKKNKNIFRGSLLKLGDETWAHDNEAEFFNDYNKKIEYASFSRHYSEAELAISIDFRYNHTTISVEANNRPQIEEIHQIFSQNADKCLIPFEDQKMLEEPTIFIGHGRSNQWRELKDHLQEKHGYKIEAFEIGSRAGHTIRDILEEMLAKSSMAFIILTAEDEDMDGKYHARENVIHELGLFQGKLGFHKAIAILEEGTNEFSNLHGIQQLRFSKSNIKEIFGDVLATLKREYH